jgi:hypothetical protein
MDGLALLGWATTLHVLVMILACVWAQVRAARREAGLRGVPQIGA